MIGAGARTRRTKLIRRQLAVAVFVQLQQGLGGVGDFVGREDAVAIRIQRGHDGRDGMMKVPAISARRRTIRRTAGRTTRRAVGSTTLRRGAIMLSIAIRPWRRGPMGPEFVRRQLAVAVFLQCQQGLGSIGDFIGRDDTVVIGIQHRDERRWRAKTASRARRAAGGGG